LLIARAPAIVLPALLLVAPASGQEARGATSGERGAMTSWASDVATEMVSAHGQEGVEASRVTLAVAGGPVLVQWSFSYRVQVNPQWPISNRQPRVEVQAMAALERDGTEIARWTLGEDEAQAPKDRMAQARVTGTASGLFVDRTPGSGPKTYVLKVWNERPSRWGVVTVSTRTMICEER
jgi:hypothetical protein